MAKKLALCAGLLVLLCFALFLINQTAQIVSLANTFSPVLGRIVLVCLLAAYTIIFLVPVAIFFRLPKTLRPPENEQSPDYSQYLQQLAARLAANPYLSGATAELTDRAGIQAALHVLDAKAGEVIKKTASTVFVSTAVSQNGRLDTFMVLIAQTRMIWQVSRIYNQRPTLREFIQLYASVATTLFAASGIEDLDISQQIEPIMKAAIGGSVVSFVPGVASVASIVMQSILDGTSNAYLTLRVGVICQSYCASVTVFHPARARRYASVTAASMLGSIVNSSASSVAKAIAAAARKAGESTVQSAAAGIRGMGEKLNPFRTGPV